MSIKYALVLRKNTRTNIKSIYAAAVNNVVTQDVIATRITEATTVTHADVLAVLKALQTETVNQMLQGNAVQYDILGTLYPTLLSKGSEDTAHFSPSQIKKIRIRFRPNNDMLSELNQRAAFEVTLTKQAAIEKRRTRYETLDAEAQASRQQEEP